MTPDWMRFLPRRLVLNLSTLGPLGYVRKGPGTAGSAAGLGFYVVFLWGSNPFMQLLICALLAWLSVFICDQAEKRFHKVDPPEIILDEFVGMPIVFLGVPLTTMEAPWVAALLGFGLFRWLDIQKPLLIGNLQNLPGGQGIVADDIAAALAACVILNTITHLFIM